MKVPQRLDRLSALLTGLAPRIDVVPLTVGSDAMTLAASPEQRLTLYLLTAGTLRLATCSGAETIAAAPAMIVCRADIGHTIRAADDSETPSLIRASARFDGPLAPLFLGQFRAALTLPLTDADSSLTQIVALIAGELDQPRCGQPALLDRAGDILFIGLLRHLVARPLTPSGLFNGLADDRIARVLVALHAAPQTSWTLERMAESAGMSRTAFATRFRLLMDQPPGSYLALLRLSIARRVVQAGSGLKRAARDAGYASPSALSRALSRRRLQDGAPAAK